MQIHELDSFISTLAGDTVFAVDDGTETTKVPFTQVANDLIDQDVITLYESIGWTAPE